MKNSVKTLVVLSPAFPANETDSTWVPGLQIFVKALKQASPDLNVVVLAFVYPYVSKIYNWHGVKVISFGSSGNGRIHQLYSYLRIWRTLRRLKRDHQLIGLLSFWLGQCAFIGNRFAKKHHLKHYTWMWGQDARAGNKFVNRIKPDGQSLIALSDFLVREFEKNYGITPQHVIPMGIDAGLFAKTNVERDIDIVGAGSLIALKQYEVFLKLIALLKPIFPNIKAVICGGGPEQTHLQQLIKKLDIGNQVSLVGERPHAEVLAYMQRAKIFLHPSVYEGFGAVCVEALYAGAKVISFVKPMDAPIPNWHIATDKQHMLNLVTDILSDKDIAYQSVLPFKVEDNAKAMLKLFASK